MSKGPQALPLVHGIEILKEILMKLSKLMFAVATLCGSATVMAAPLAAEIARISGASALKGNFARALNTLCVANSGVMQEWISGGNISTYVCTPAGGLTSGASGTYASTASGSFVKFGGSEFSEVRLNVAGGSFTALQTLAGGSDRYLNPGLGTVSNVGGAANAGVAGGTVNTEPGLGGFSDVQVDGYASNVKATVPGLDDAVANNYGAQVGVAQGFGVAVSDALYQAMFVRQQTDGLIPAAPTCTAASTANPICVPSISKGQFASIISNFNGSAAKVLGAQFLASQLPAASELRYVRRVDTSGTQATAQNYFLGIGNMTQPVAVFTDPSNRTNPLAVPVTTGCNANDVRGPLATDLEVDTAFVASGQINLCDNKVSNLRVLAAPGTGDVRNELLKATILGGATNYAIGVMSLENDQASYTNAAGVAGIPTTWKWLRVQGAPGADNAVPGANSNRLNLTSGLYDFYYELWAYIQDDVDGKNRVLIDEIIGALSTGPALDGLTVIGTAAGQQPFNRNGRTDTPSSR